jgi:hypothetical protein
MNYGNKTSIKVFFSPLRREAKGVMEYWSDEEIRYKVEIKI